jgi:hypothetical protein
MRSTPFRMPACSRTRRTDGLCMPLEPITTNSALSRRRHKTAKRNMRSAKKKGPSLQMRVSNVLVASRVQERSGGAGYGARMETVGIGNAMKPKVNVLRDYDIVSRGAGGHFIPDSYSSTSTTWKLPCATGWLLRTPSPQSGRVRHSDSTPRSRAFRSFTQSPLVRRTRFVGAGGEDATRTRQAFCTTDWHSQRSAAPKPRATEMRADTSQVAVCSAEFEWMGRMRRTGWGGFGTLLAARPH